MVAFEVLRIVVVTLLLSAIAPGVLFVAGVADRDLLVIVFAPSVVVGVAVSWFARRAVVPRKAWAFDSRRMP